MAGYTSIIWSTLEDIPFNLNSTRYFIYHIYIPQLNCIVNTPQLIEIILYSVFLLAILIQLIFIDLTFCLCFIFLKQLYSIEIWYIYSVIIRNTYRWLLIARQPMNAYSYHRPGDAHLIILNKWSPVCVPKIYYVL